MPSSRRIKRRSASGRDSAFGVLRPGHPMPLGFHFRMECRIFVPEGHTILAQRFNVGSGHRLGASPEGTTEPGLTASAVPSGLLDVSNAKPNAEALGYFQKSLRDESEILVTLGLRPAVEGGVSPPGKIGRPQSACHPVSVSPFHRAGCPAVRQALRPRLWLHEIGIPSPGHGRPTTL